MTDPEEPKVLAFQIDGKIRLAWEKPGEEEPVYVMATDNDFRVEGDYFEYRGMGEYIIIPETIKSVPVTSCKWMFSMYDKSQLKGVALLSDNVTDMSWMFDYCENLTTLDLSSLNTSSVTDMSAMFNFCENLTTLDLSNFDTENATNMRWMFQGCGSLTTLDLSSFDTSSVTDMTNIFNACENLWYVSVRNETEKDKFKAATNLPIHFVVGDVVEPTSGPPPFYFEFTWTESVSGSFIKYTKKTSSAFTVPMDCMLRVTYDATESIANEVGINDVWSAVIHEPYASVELKAGDEVAFAVENKAYNSDATVEITIHTNHYRDVPSFNETLVIPGGYI